MASGERKIEVELTDRDLAFSWLYYNVTRLQTKRDEANSIGNRKKANKINTRLGHVNQDLDRVMSGESKLIDQFANWERARRAEIMDQDK